MGIHWEQEYKWRLHVHQLRLYKLRFCCRLLNTFCTCIAMRINNKQLIIHDQIKVSKYTSHNMLLVFLPGQIQNNGWTC